MNNQVIARIVLVVLALVLVGAGLVPLLAADDLPDRLASQWSFSGEVTSTISASALRIGVAVVLVPTALVLVGVAFTRREARPGSRLMWVGVVAMVAAIVAGAATHIAFTNQNATSQGATDWAQVPGPAVWTVVLVIGAGIAAGGVAGWAAAALPESALPPAKVYSLDVADTAVVAWSRTLSVRWLLALTAVMGAVGVGLALVAGDPWIGVVMVLSALPAALLARIEVFADRRGLTVTYGPWAWPSTRIPLDRLAAAEAIDLRPNEWGGWGYRGSVKLFRRAAVVLRAGPGLRVDLTDGRQFAVTIDDPETAAAVLQREVGAR